MVVVWLIAGVATRRVSAEPGEGSECRPVLTPGLLVLVADTFAEYAVARYAGVVVSGWLVPAQIAVLTLALSLIIRTGAKPFAGS